MKQIRLFIVAGLLLAWAIPAMAADASSPVHLNYRLRLGYDDNIYQVDDNNSATGLDKTGSFRVINELEVLVNLNLERTYLGLRYRPTLNWYNDREPTSTDFLNDLDFNFTHNFSPVLSLSLNDTLRSGQLPELTDGEYVVRENDDNYYNSALGTLSYKLRPETRLDASARYITLIYSSDSPAKKNNDYYSIVGGLTLRQQLASRTTVMGDFRYQSLVYNEADAENDRDADSVFAGLGLEQTFNPQLLGNLRLGGENRMYSDDAFDDNTEPYADVSVTYMPSPATRFTASGSYSIYEADVAAYLSQIRNYLSLSAAHDFTAKWSFYISGAYTLNSYRATYSLDPAVAGDADETSYLVSARVSYRLNRINWLEAGWQFVSLDSEVTGRENYDRNRVDIGWKIQLF